MTFGLTPKTIQKIQAVFAKYPCVEKVILYGSRAIGNYKTGSDIDLTLFGDRQQLRDHRSKISADLYDLPIPYTIDVSLFSEIENPDLIEHIHRVGQIFYLSTS